MLHLFVAIIFNGCGIFTSDTPSTTIEEKSHNERGNGKESLVKAKTGYTTERILYSIHNSRKTSVSESENLIGNKTQAQPSSNTKTHKSIFKGTIDGTNAANPLKSSKIVTFNEKEPSQIWIFESLNESSTDFNKGNLSAENKDTMPAKHISPSFSQQKIPDESKESSTDRVNQVLSQSSCEFFTHTPSTVIPVYKIKQCSSHVEEPIIVSKKRNPSNVHYKNSPNPQQKSKPKFNSENEYGKFNQDLKNHMNNFLNRKPEAKRTPIF
ncbi:hypothetical protein CWI38_2337p0010 [Hamiltosporidium tvaerminnensis]|uniref:Uncharacterized protein n=1 Tax=Hamiltosporidium tvaerminnensis TaxID=1176355 RepID=A0A4V6MVH8_9MICR|nr:hypothetical protein CWI38_2337p0010 [Hamiltosporidium tvaerminnensis]